MFFVKIAGRYINLRWVVMISEVGNGDLEVTCSNEKFRVTGTDAIDFRALLEDVSDCNEDSYEDIDDGEMD